MRWTRRARRKSANWAARSDGTFPAEDWTRVHAVVEKAAGQFADMPLAACIVLGIWDAPKGLGITVMAPDGLDLRQLLPLLVDSLANAAEGRNDPGPMP